MASKEDFVVYAPLPSNSHPQNVVVLLPSYRRPRHDCHFLRCTSPVFLFLLLAAAVFIFYPSDPDIQVVRVQLNHVQVKSSPSLILDLSFSVTSKVRNRNFFSFDYDSLVVSVGYRGRELGFVTSDGGRLRARGSSYMNSTLDLNGFEVIHDVFYLIEDLAKGVIPFDTVTEVDGKLGLFLFHIPLKARVACEVYVNTSNQTIVRQNCYPK